MIGNRVNTPCVPTADEKSCQYRLCRVSGHPNGMAIIQPALPHSGYAGNTPFISRNQLDQFVRFDFISFQRAPGIHLEGHLPMVLLLS